MRKKILILTPRLPYPPVGGDRLRIYHICRYLSQGFDLTLLSLCETEEEMHEHLPEDGIFARVERVPHRLRTRFMGLARTLPSAVPMQVGYYRNREFEQRVWNLAPDHDGVLAHLVRTAEYLLPLRIPKIVEMTDAISLSYARTAAQLGGIKGAAYSAEARRLKRFEKHIVRSCDRTVLVSSVDRDSLELGAEERKVLICSNGVDTGALPFEYAPDGKTIVFLGKNTFRPNVDAITYFAQAILPLVRKHSPEARFRVVGEISPEFAHRLRAQGIEVTGRVESVREATRGASVGVCPLRFGAGVQNKLLEYMSLGIPAVTSPMGLEGLNSVPGRDVAVASTPQEWLEWICSFLHRAERGSEFARAGRRYVEEHHSWAAHLAPLGNAMRLLTEHLA